MPNHVFNRVTVSGSEEEIQRLMSYAFNEEGQFSFQKFMPMPQALLEINTGATTINGVRSRAWRTIGGKSVPVSDEEMAELRLRYGADNWYDWSIANWGTKWEAYSTDKDGLNPSVFKQLRRGGHLEFTFTTAWSTPDPVRDHLLKEFSSLRFEWYYDDEGGKAGYL